MSIYLKDIDNQNWEQCIMLTTNKEGKHFICEEFVASNALSIAQSKIQKGWITKAIYDEDTMIGFTMYGFCYENNFYEICRIMIDHKYQGKGYGRKALGKVIEEMKSFKDCNEIFLSFDPENQIGKKLYESFNFKATGRIIDDELLYSLSLK
ncbi:GNAT family N-acetyltransferase [Clostridium manihotivorum]|uniref:Diadenosine tetraphosphatase n=1 Tax=Clostridium manihotivorum TaxID=2320868 RepID=A0A410DT90_9CLOT|nr:GNAT family N-acetyltransferase [Clostridium manihotivorum]QAA32334.1 diadenosine tetraphosphatase [Clostridium manihotivorum]